jgi:hypothetical protein
VPGEFYEAELPDIPDGFRYATHVRVNITHRDATGTAFGRYRHLMAVMEYLA